VDIAYLREHPEHLPTFLTHQRIRETPVHGGSIASASRLTLDDGNSIFTKTWPEGSNAPDGYFAAESAGLRWLAEVPDGVATPEVIIALPGLIALEWIDEGRPTAAAARRFGAALARTHGAGAERFGAPWPGFIGSLPLDNTPTAGLWSAWFGSRRLRPYLDLSVNRGAVSPAEAATISLLIEHLSEYAGPADQEPPARLHGDLWPGNLMWSAAGSAVAIDPAAHGGNRESDIAQLHLWGGVPYLDELIAGYEAQAPLADGWRDRIPLHQLHLLLVHTSLFGDPYREALMSAVRATVKK
jgi:fructosamine-3-kinase